MINNTFCNSCINLSMINRMIPKMIFKAGIECLNIPFVLMNENCCIYKITNPPKYIYIGQTKNFIKRGKKYCSLGNIKGQIRLYRSIKKYGWEAHTFEKIHICMPCELNDLEVYYIKLYDSFDTPHGMNLQSGGHKNVDFSEETLKKMSESAKKRPPISEETRKKLSESAKKLVMSIESKNKISQSNKGRKRTEEQKRLISERTKEAMSKPDVRKRFLEGNKNKAPITEETRKKMSKAVKRRGKGKKHTLQSRKNMSEGRKKKNIIPWNKGLKGVTVPWNKGKRYKNKKRIK